MEIFYAVTRTRRRNYEDIFTDLRRPVATATSLDIPHAVRYGCRTTTGTRGRTSATRMEFYSGSRWRRWQRSRTPERAFSLDGSPRRAVGCVSAFHDRAGGRNRSGLQGRRTHRWAWRSLRHDWRSAPNPSPAHDRCVGRLREPEMVLPRSSAGIRPQISQAPTTRVERQLL